MTPRLLILSVMLTVILGLGELAKAAGPVLNQDCVIAWGGNGETDLAGYRIYLGRVPGLRSQMKDLGNVTSAQCSQAGANTNGQWYAAVSAYDTSGNESMLSNELPFQLAALPIPAPPVQVHEPTASHLTTMQPGFQLMWTDTNRGQTSHRIEISSPHHSTWTTATVRPPGVTRFTYFHPVDVEWLCYRLRAESGSLVSAWAQASGPNDRQFCLAPSQPPSLGQPIVASTIMYEPTAVELKLIQPGFQLIWADARPGPISHRIEVSGSVNPAWTTLTVLPPGVARFTYAHPIDAEWVCFRVRAESGRLVSLWAQASGPNDRAFCYSPS
ncbi:MAG: hypothetical protein ACT4OO_10660 [Nitrospiraceae bacterium]